ncbi:MAG: PHP domain-containing protein [Candidatus Hydrogenedentes bacterium]|nr:PHP domain-containing protein [Candidatus Hydrogenedentota bacterium]
MKVDIHCRTERYSPGSKIAPKELIQMAEAAGYDAVFLTDRGKVWSSRELAAMNEMCDRLRILPGIEIALPEGMDILVLGADNPVYESLTTPSEVFAQACADGYLTVIAQAGERSGKLPKFCALADAVETVTCRQPDPARTKGLHEYGASHRMAELYASEAEGLNYLNRHWVETLEPFATPQEFRHIVVARRYENRSRESAELIVPGQKAATLAELSEADMMALYIQPTLQSLNP